MPGQSLKTKAFVLRRTNLGEADRLLDLLTPEGKLAVYARSVRKEKSRLAGGIEMFCLSEVAIHQNPVKNRNILTSAKMLKFYNELLSDLPRLELASEILRRISRAAESVDHPVYFSLVEQSLSGLDQGLNPNLVSAWFHLNLAKAKGEPVNLLTDTAGEKLRPENTYVWDSTELALRPFSGGSINANHIKFMRLMLSSPLALASRVQNGDSYLPEILHIAKSLNQL